ncbi:Snf3p [Sugiyamaella lignohabitans]|uniref:Snf3p n=1 Tax=Sugiyamaella lignohabitans TaxID=796027 RepID=A0A167CEW8_9ASCO|nr:Snf3p [Sugiyamaella lignohabitans]ANB11599.1 Snf3p [Sugiyamaella lignohabitans]
MILPKIYNQYFVAIIATIGGALFGFDISSMSATIGTPQYLDYFNSPSPSTQGGINASMPGGSLVGSLVAGIVCDMIGRKYTIQFSCFLWIVGSTISCASQNVAMLIVGRFINGLCVGVTSSQIPVYLSEISRHERRGRIVVIQQLAIEWGILILFFIGYGCSYIPGTASFRITWGLQMVPGFVLIFLMPMLPESPRYLASKDRWDECHEILAQVHAKGNKDDTVVLAEMMDIRTIVELERDASSTYLALFSKKNWRRSMVGIMSQVWQQLAGGNVMLYFVVYVFQMAGLTGQINLIASSVQYVIMVIFTTPVMFYVDKVGRRPLLIIGAIGMGTFVFAVGGILATYGKYADEVGGNANIHITLEGQFGPSRGVLVCSYLFVLGK